MQLYVRGFNLKGIEKMDVAFKETVQDKKRVEYRTTNEAQRKLLQMIIIKRLDYSMTKCNLWSLTSFQSMAKDKGLLKHSAFSSDCDGLLRWRKAKWTAHFQTTLSSWRRTLTGVRMLQIEYHVEIPKNQPFYSPPSYYYHFVSIKGKKKRRREALWSRLHGTQT